jgi:DHA3 family macrolide efflux protein-like MFS transporter
VAHFTRKQAGLADLFQHRGGRTFVWVAFGQTISIFGTNLTAFALGIWLFDTTGQATPLALSVLAGFLPGALLGPYAGVWVDRISRKWAMLLSDLAQGACTSALLLFLSTGRLEPWAIYCLLALSSAVGVMQYPALSASISLLIPGEHLGRANGLLSFGEGLGSLFAPILAGILVPLIGIGGVMLIDVTSFVASAFVLLFLTIPNPPHQGFQPKERGFVLHELHEGWSYITRRPGLLGLLVISSLLNLIGIFVTARLNIPLVLARSDGNTALLGVVSSAFGAGMIIGGIVMTAWGGPKKRIYGVFGAMIGIGLSYQVLFSIGQSGWVWVLASFLGSFFIPIQSGSANAIWQSKVAPEIQGRVFALRRAVGQVLTPVGLLIVGPLADQVARPLIQGSLGGTLAPLLGMGAGRNFALVMFCFGLLTVAIAITGLLLPRVRRVEEEIPDTVLKAN